MRRIKKIIRWCGGFLVLFTLFGFFILPPVVKSILVKKLSENLHRQVTIQKIKINPYALTIDVKGLLVKERGSAENFASLDEIFVNLSSLSLAKRAVILEEARIVKPYFKVVRRKDDSYNFSDLMEKPKSEPEKKTEPVRFSLNNISISGGSIDFIDGPKDTTHRFGTSTLRFPRSQTGNMISRFLSSQSSPPPSTAKIFSSRERQNPLPIPCRRILISR